jgi:hypothetical protein
MQITFTKKLPVRVFSLYLEIERYSIRKDIQRFLQQYTTKGVGFEDETLNNQVIKYLQQINLLDKNGTLTDKGETAKTKALVAQVEAGKYTVFCCPDHLNHSDKQKIICLQRERTDKTAGKDFAAQKISPHNYFLAQHETIIMEQNNSSEPEIIRIADSMPQDIHCEVKEPEELVLTWIWHDLNNSNYTYNAHFQKNGIISKINLSLPFKPNKPLNYYLPEWNNNLSAYQIAFSQTSNHERKQFKKTFSTKHPHFDDIKLENLPIIPNTTLDCEAWRDWCLTNTIDENKYISLSDFDKFAYAETQRPQFFHFRLPALTQSDFLAKAKAKNWIKSYWYAAAMNDIS